MNLTPQDQARITINGVIRDFVLNDGATMRIHTVDHEATKADSNTVRIRYVENDEHGYPGKHVTSSYNKQEIELFITYLKGIRDGMGWNERHSKQ